jgi:UDP-glucose:(heptosyl)LPS alpha-1,3-glucosyltransferase
VIGKDNKMAEYIAKARELGLSQHVRFFGPQSDIRPFYQFADVLVIPSFYDPFANVTVEALAMGLFVISSRYNGGSEILTPENGLIIEDLLAPDSLSQALAEGLKHPKTIQSANASRDSVKHLDFSLQMNILMKACLE